MGMAAWESEHECSCPSLQSASGVTEKTRLDSNMPDLCIAYQLHLECGRLINLYDWLQVCTSMGYFTCPGVGVIPATVLFQSVGYGLLVYAKPTTNNCRQ